MPKRVGMSCPTECILPRKTLRKLLGQDIPTHLRAWEVRGLSRSFLLACTCGGPHNRNERQRTGTLTMPNPEPPRQDIFGPGGHVAPKYLTNEATLVLKESLRLARETRW